MVGPKVLASLKDSQTLQVCPMRHMHATLYAVSTQGPHEMAISCSQPGTAYLSLSQSRLLGYRNCQCAIRNSAGPGAAVVLLVYTDGLMSLSREEDSMTVLPCGGSP